MGLFISVEKADTRARSVVEEERERERTIALDEYTEAKEEGWLQWFLYLIKNWEYIMPRWKQLCVLYAMLLVMSGFGGVIFYLCEYNAEADLLNKRSEFLTRLENTYNTEQLDMILNWGQEADEFVYPTDEFPNGRNKWEFRYACFFAATTFTTNGFGLQAPVTTGGRIAVLFYGVPSIVAYVWISKSIGSIVLSFFGRAITYFRCISYEYYMHKRLSIVALLALCLSLLMSWVIFSIRTDEGFGNGVYTYFDAFYFLFQTTMTIGYGDVMMSGGSQIGTALLGCWLATSIGVVVCLLSEIGEQFKIRESNDDSQQSSRKSLVGILEPTKVKLELGKKIEEQELS